MESGFHTGRDAVIPALTGLLGEHQASSGRENREHMPSQGEDSNSQDGQHVCFSSNLLGRGREDPLHVEGRGAEKRLFHWSQTPSLHFLCPFFLVQAFNAIHGLSFAPSGEAPWKSLDSSHI